MLFANGYTITRMRTNGPPRPQEENNSTIPGGPGNAQTRTAAWLDGETNTPCELRHGHALATGVGRERIWYGPPLVRP